MRKFLFKLLYPLLKLIGKVHLPYSRKRLMAVDYRDAIRFLQAGFVLLGKRWGEATNILIPGYWPHCAIYAGDGKVVEATSKGVVTTDLIDFILSRDEVAIFAPQANETQREIAVANAMANIGADYDYMFETSNKAFYCAELVYDAYESCGLPIKKKVVLGEDTFVPDYIANNDKAWTLVWKR